MAAAVSLAGLGTRLLGAAAAVAWLLVVRNFEMLMVGTVGASAVDTQIDGGLLGYTLVPCTRLGSAVGCFEKQRTAPPTYRVDA